MSRRLLPLDQLGPNLLADGAWEPYIPEVPFTRDGDTFDCPCAPEGVAVIDKPDERVSAGIVQTVTVNQTAPQLLVATAWSQHDEFRMMRPYDYAIAMELIGDDGTVMGKPWTPFQEYNHDWHQGRLHVIPPRPVKEVRLHLVFLGQAGSVRFRQPTLHQLTAKTPGVSLDALPLAGVIAPVEGLWVRDVAAGSDLIPAAQAAKLGLSVRLRPTCDVDAARFECTVADTTGADRAVTVIYTAPVTGRNVRWLCETRRSDPTRSPGEYVTVGITPTGSNGMLSRWPMAAVASEDGGQAISVDMGQPAFYRVGYSAGTRELFLACDIALTPERPEATFGFSTFSFDATWELRGALAKLYRVYPNYFRCRTPEQGLWLPFCSPRAIEGWEDFGFKFQEGAGDSVWCNEHGILSFEYCEPLTWWMAIPPEEPRTMENAMARVKALAEAGDLSARSFASSVFHSEIGRPAGKALYTPWCDGIVWSMNSAPDLSGEVNHYRTKWNDTLIDRLYGPNAVDPVSGHYVDSAEGYITEELDYRRDHFAPSNAPLVFAAGTLKPAVFMGLIVWDFCRQLALDVRRFDKFTMANTTPGRFCWLTPWLDVMGTETNWNIEGQWRPQRDEDLMYCRAMCATKPYCFLMNTNFDEFTRECTLRYMTRCLLYGMFPGFFSPNAAENVYFFQPERYNRDRDLFKKYVPLIQRVAEAGWQPITNATVEGEKVYIERFGENILTVFNDTGRQREITVTLLGDWPGECADLVTGRTFSANGGAITLTLGHEDVAALVFE